MKKIRINLYSSEFKPKKIILSLPQMIVIWCVVGVVMVSLAYYSQMKKDVLAVEEDKVNAEYYEQLGLRDTMQARVTAQIVDKSLEREVNDLKVLSETKSVLIEVMQQKNVLKSHGYAGFFHDLASVTPSGISLERIYLNERNADLYGKVKQSYLVPKWVSSFGKTNDLSTFSFGAVQIEHDVELGITKFALTSENKLKEDVDSLDEASTLVSDNKEPHK